VSSLAGTEKTMPIVSRVIAVLSAAAILLGAHASIRVDRGAADAVRTVSTTTPHVALDAAPSNGPTLTTRSSSHSATSLPTPLPARAHSVPAPAVGRQVAAADPRAQRDTSVAGRGYDATAPPALS
jgi:hypothetical protein